MIAKFWHVLGVVLMLGNVIVTGLWAHWALERNEPAVDAFAARAVIRADVACTLLGGFLLTVSGGWMVGQGGWSVLHTPWLWHGMVALAASTGLWLGALLPDQGRMRRLADAGEALALRRIYRRWALLGWGATGLLLYALWAMVVKG